jgi:hypothetical protein
MKCIYCQSKNMISFMDPGGTGRLYGCEDCGSVWDQNFNYSAPSIPRRLMIAGHVTPGRNRAIWRQRLRFNGWDNPELLREMVMLPIIMELRLKGLQKGLERKREAQG